MQMSKSLIISGYDVLDITMRVEHHYAQTNTNNVNKTMVADIIAWAGQFAGIKNQTMHRFEQYLKILQLYHENSRFPPSFKS
jgi:hypothetical protein